ncbi:MAG TPA: hypothetical protein VF174_05345 [Micromonosporaceae bacterium]
MEAPEETKRLVRRLIGEGREITAQRRITNNPGSLFQLLYRALLSRSQPDRQRVAHTARALDEQGWGIPSELARAPFEQRFRVLRDASHRRDARELAAVLGDLALMIVQRYRGDLRRLRSAARQDPQVERRLLAELPGIDDKVVDVFFRDVQVVWRELAPFADRPALTAGRRLGLGGTAEGLAALAGSPASERFFWLVTALSCIDQDRRYADYAAVAA